MIRSDAEYHEACSQFDESTKEISRLMTRLRARGLEPSEITRLLEPLVRDHEQLRLNIMSYRRRSRRVEQ